MTTEPLSTCIVMMNPVLLYELAYTSSNINESPSDGGSEVTE